LRNPSCSKKPFAFWAEPYLYVIFLHFGLIIIKDVM